VKKIEKNHEKADFVFRICSAFDGMQRSAKSATTVR
jgi:hypothetical protein